MRKAFVVALTLVVGTVLAPAALRSNLNLPGPARFSSDGSTLRGTGRWLFFGEAGFLGRPGPTLEESAGNFTIYLTTVTFTSRTGTSRALCSALA